jgi:hypothetical protein
LLACRQLLGFLTSLLVGEIGLVVPRVCVCVAHTFSPHSTQFPHLYTIIIIFSSSSSTSIAITFFSCISEFVFFPSGDRIDQ